MKVINISCQDYLKKINSFNSSTLEKISDSIKTSIDETTDKGINLMLFQVFGSMSPFKKLGNDIYIYASNIFDTSDSINTKTNSWHCEIFIIYLLKQLIPILPLWCTDIPQEITNDNNNDYRKNNIIENRFRILKHVCLNERSQHRIDEFSDILKKQSLAIQKLAVLDSLKQVR